MQFQRLTRLAACACVSARYNLPTAATTRRADTSEPGPSLDELVPADEVLLFLQSSFASHVDSESEFDTLVMKAVDAVLSLSSQQAGVEPDAADCIQPDRFREQVKGMATHGAAPQMSVPDFVALQGQQPEAVLVVLDVRTAEEAAVSMIPGARRCPVVRDDGAPYGWRLAADSGVADLQAHVERMRFAAERAMEEAAVAAQVAAVDDGNDAAATAPLPALPALSIHVVAYCNTGERGGAAAVELSKLLGVPVHNLCGGAITYYNKGGFMVAAAPAAEPAAEAEAPPGSEGTAAAAPNAAVAQQQQQYQQAAAPQPVNALHPGVLKCLGLIKRRNAFDVKLLKRPGSSALY